MTSFNGNIFGSTECFEDAPFESLVRVENVYWEALQWTLDLNQRRRT